MPNAVATLPHLVDLTLIGNPALRSHGYVSTAIAVLLALIIPERLACYVHSQH
mgnify:CR=1 FL=1